MNDEDFISVRDAAAILNLSPKTVHNRNGGTGHLTRVKQGRTVSLLRSEVLEYKRQLISEAKEISSAMFDH